MAAELLKVVIYPDPFLTKRCREVTPAELQSGTADGWSLSNLVDRMRETMYHEEGVGLAAPQVGVGLRLFTGDVSSDKTGFFAIFNPVLDQMRGTLLEEEGCLSIPDVRAKVKRSAYLRMRGLDLQGKPVEFHASDLLSRVCQHETDHLDGTLFITRIGMTAKLRVRKSLIELETKYQERLAKLAAEQDALANQVVIPMK